jgi:hypothetical protein
VQEQKGETAVSTLKNGVFWDVTPSGSVRTDVSEELIASIIRVTRTTLAVTSNRRTLRRNSSPILVTLMTEALSSSETFRKLDLFASSGERNEAPTLLGPTL